MCQYKLTRSPWSNEYFPAFESDFYPSERLRNLEMKANHMIQEYRSLYYEGVGVSNTYFWDKEERNFAACYLIKK